MVSHEDFTTPMQAKEFLVSRIVAQVRRRHVHLSEREGEMLYFSESFP
jgi:hypothetical protein